MTLSIPLFPHDVSLQTEHDYCQITRTALTVFKVEFDHGLRSILQVKIKEQQAQYVEDAAA